VEPFEATKSRMPPQTQERVLQTIVNIDKLLELKKQKELEEQDLAFGASELYELAEVEHEQTKRARASKDPLGIKPE
jgi:hypothetical protein